ncbi:MAG: NAD(P)-dependent oxidoreductase [Candidatus Obscuribacterales bacterium]|nr:NAD(P)-dependent oxidoreductase [Candidatus Obscuribacterales bacterium]
MKIFLTGGNGDLGQMLCTSLIGMGHTPVIFDIAVPQHPPNRTDRPGIPGIPVAEFIEGSILNREQLRAALKDIDIVVHIAAWHGIHEFRKEKTVYDFWDLNVGGTFNVFQCAIENDIKDIIFISSTSIDERYGVYGHSKILGEEVASAYAHRHGMNVITLRPRAFIPPWNKSVYSNFIEWCEWFSKGAVHISDVSQAVLKSVDLLASKNHDLQNAPAFLTVDGAYQYSDEDLKNWDVDGPGSTFKRHYAQFYDLAVGLGLNTTLKPKKLDITETQRLLNYKPLYSMKTMLLELKKYGPAGPYQDRPL